MADGFSSDRRGQVEPAVPGSSTHALIVAVILIGGLYAGRDVFVPIVLAVLLSFVLAIPVRLLQARGLGRTFPVAIVVLLAFGIILSLGAALTGQLTQLATDLPRYQSTVRTKISDLKGAAAGSLPLERAADMLQTLSLEFATTPRARPDAPNPAGGAVPQRPVPVEITNPSGGGALQTVTGFVAPLLHPLATTGLVVIFVIFILLQRGDLRNRLIRLAGSHDLQRTTAAMNDAARRLSRFFLAQVLLNATFGIVVGVALWLIGVPSPVLWGILAAVSRFVPYVGAIIAAVGPLLLAAAVDPGWGMLLAVAGLFVVVELVVGQVVEPLLYGHSTGLSPMAVIVSVTFWTALWGPIGLLLATPLTVCLVVLGRHVEHLAFLDVMLGDRPPLTVAESFYQRMLAGDPGEAYEQAEVFLRDHALATYYDEVALKGLALAQADAARGLLDDSHLHRVEATVAELIEELSDQDDVVTPSDSKKTEKRAAGDADLDDTLAEADAQVQTLPVVSVDELRSGWQGGLPVLCIAGRNALDAAGASMLAQVLGKHGLPAQVEGAEALSSAGIFRLAAPHARIVVLSYLDTSNPVQIRYAVRRVRRRLPGVKVIVGSWALDEEAARSLCEPSGADGCADRLAAAVRICLDLAQEEASKAMTQERPTEAPTASAA